MTDRARKAAVTRAKNAKAKAEAEARAKAAFHRECLKAYDARMAAA